MTKAYRYIIPLAVAAPALCLCLLLLDARALVKAQFGAVAREDAAWRDLADRHARQIEQDLRLREDAMLAEVKALHASADSQLTAARGVVDQRTGQMLEIANDARQNAAEQVAGIREDAKPVLTNAAALEANSGALAKDAQDSLDDSYWDLKALLESADVAATSVAQTSEVVRNAAPKMAEAAVKNGENIAGITADVHTATSAFVKPKSTWQKIKSALWLIAYGAAHAL